jgi:protein-tyrosine phosphatase
MGIRTQVTASAFCGAFGRTVQRHAEELLREGLVHVVASDAHDAQRRRPGLQEPMRDSAGAAWVAWATQHVPAATLANEALPPAPDIELPRRSRWRRR